MSYVQALLLCPGRWENRPCIKHMAMQSNKALGTSFVATLILHAFVEILKLVKGTGRIAGVDRVPVDQD